MTSAELKDILLSAEFGQGLGELSSYLASIMQEGPIVHLLAKCLWKNKGRYEFELEAGRYDLTVNGTRLEFKFNYDKMAEVLKGELAKYANDLRRMWAAVEAGEKSKSWGVMAGIYKDVCVKQPDIFVWIICARDLSNLAPGHLERISAWRGQVKYRDAHPYGSDREFLAIADTFLEKLRAVRQFSVLNAEIATVGDFPSTYHFRICEFSKTT